MPSVHILLFVIVTTCVLLQCQTKCYGLEYEYTPNIYQTKRYFYWDANDFSKQGWHIKFASGKAHNETSEATIPQKVKKLPLVCKNILYILAATQSTFIHEAGLLRQDTCVSLVFSSLLAST